MKVKIIKCSGKEFWYKDNIGEIFKVEEYSEDDYATINPNKRGCILRSDCTLIEEPETIKITVDEYNDLINDIAELKNWKSDMESVLYGYEEWRGTVEERLHSIEYKVSRE